MGNGALDGITAERLASLTGAHVSTARRWKRLAPTRPWLARLVRLTIEGELGEISPAWSGWCLRHGTLVSPEGWQFTPGEVRSIPFLHAQVRGLQAEARTHLQADWIAERYVEADGTVAPRLERRRR